MAQHLPIQAKHHFQLKQHTQLVTWCTVAWQNRPRPPGGTCPPPGASSLPAPTVFSSPPGGAYRAARRLTVQTLPTLGLSPGGINQTAKRHTSNFLLLIWHPKCLTPKFQNVLECTAQLSLSEFIDSPILHLPRYSPCT
ncbi:hypothetical protein DEO72_LG2g4094 [Vigna unguiculata]|uniref:Uncharacterized protein n=1 Tax=Vigna unguiculata TaxID=3917 RepID=A0A4D6L5F7_VIGUN|nr:hypothetical protein DEO72_LG2g4094 [Vigna unguiculata]